MESKCFLSCSGGGAAAAVHAEMWWVSVIVVVSRLSKEVYVVGTSFCEREHKCQVKRFFSDFKLVYNWVQISSTTLTCVLNMKTCKIN